MMRPVEFVGFACPWCGEPGEVTVEMVSGDPEWVEDCAVCCSPIVFRRLDDGEDDLPRIDVRREGE